MPTVQFVPSHQSPPQGIERSPANWRLAIKLRLATRRTLDSWRYIEPQCPNFSARYAGLPSSFQCKLSNRIPGAFRAELSRVVRNLNIGLRFRGCSDPTSEVRVAADSYFRQVHECDVAAPAVHIIPPLFGHFEKICHCFWLLV